MQVGNHLELRIIARIKADSSKHAEHIEKTLHKKFASDRLRGEWFFPAVLKHMHRLQEDTILQAEPDPELEQSGPPPHSAETLNQWGLKVGVGKDLTWYRQLSASMKSEKFEQKRRDKRQRKREKKILAKGKSPGRE